MVPLQATGLAALGLSNSTLHDFTEDLQGMVEARVSAEVPSPYLSAPTGKIAALSLLHLRFAYGVAADGTSLPFGRRLPEGKVLWKGYPP